MLLVYYPAGLTECNIRRIVIEPALAENFLKVIENHTAGDPMRGDIKGTNLSRRQIAERMGRPRYSGPTWQRRARKPA